MTQAQCQCHMVSWLDLRWRGLHGMGCRQVQSENSEPLAGGWGKEWTQAPRERTQAGPLGLQGSPSLWTHRRLVTKYRKRTLAEYQQSNLVPLHWLKLLQLFGADLPSSRYRCPSCPMWEHLPPSLVSGCVLAGPCPPGSGSGPAPLPTPICNDLSWAEQNLKFIV